MIIAPRKVYPNMVVQVQVSIFKLYYDHITIRASIRKDGEEHAAFLEKFDTPTTKVLQMKVSSILSFVFASLKFNKLLLTYFSKGFDKFWTCISLFPFPDVAQFPGGKLYIKSGRNFRRWHQWQCLCKRDRSCIWYEASICLHPNQQTSLLSRSKR